MRVKRTIVLNRVCTPFTTGQPLENITGSQTIAGTYKAWTVEPMVVMVATVSVEHRRRPLFFHIPTRETREELHLYM